MAPIIRQLFSGQHHTEEEEGWRVADKQAGKTVGTQKFTEHEAIVWTRGARSRGREKALCLIVIEKQTQIDTITSTIVGVLLRDARASGGQTHAPPPSESHGIRARTVLLCHTCVCSRFWGVEEGLFRLAEHVYAGSMPGIILCISLAVSPRVGLGAAELDSPNTGQPHEADPPTTDNYSASNGRGGVAERDYSRFVGGDTNNNKKCREKKKKSQAGAGGRRRAQESQERSGASTDEANKNYCKSPSGRLKLARERDRLAANKQESQGVLQASRRVQRALCSKPRTARLCHRGQFLSRGRQKITAPTP